MIPAVAQALAELLSRASSVISKEHIYFNHPGFIQDERPALNLYCYHVGISHWAPDGQATVAHDDLEHGSMADKSESYQLMDLRFLISVADHTALGEQHLLSEALMTLLTYSCLPDEAMAPKLRGWGGLPIQVSEQGVSEAAKLWLALGVPLRPAIHVTVTVPFRRCGAPLNPALDLSRAFSPVVETPQASMMLTPQNRR